jgi:hypothetical protein
MFSSSTSNAPSRMSQDLAISDSKHYAANKQYEIRANQARARAMIDQANAIKLIATNMVADFEKSKNIFKLAVIAYLNNIEHAFFRSSGRQRAQTLKYNIINSNTVFELIDAIEKILYNGNEDSDSLKNFLFKAAYSNFSDQTRPVHFFSYTYRLRSIIEAVRELNNRTELKTMPSGIVQK